MATTAHAAALYGHRASGALLVFRAGLGVVCLALLAVPGASGPLWLGEWWLLWAVLIIGAVDLAFYVLSRCLPGRRLLSAQIAVDLLLVSALVYLTGGINSIFVFLPFACVLTAAVVLSGYLSLLYASLATVLLAGVSIAYSLCYLGHVDLPWVASAWVVQVRPTLPRTLALVAGQGLALHVVAYLGGSLAARLRRETHLKEEILDTIAEGLIVADAGLRVVFVNGEALKLLGFASAEQLLGQRWGEVFRRRGDRQVRQMLSPRPPVLTGRGGLGALPVTASRADAPWPADDEGPAWPAAALRRSRVIQFDDRERGKRYLSVKTSPFRRRHDTLGGVVAIFHDITAEREMEAVQERAERLQEISLVAAGIAHELRNPLASIRGCVQELARLDAANPRTQRLAEIAASETDRLDQIISEFLDFARMRPPRPVPLDLHALIEEVIVLLQTGRCLAGIEIEADIPAGLSLNADRDQLKQVLMNLTQNAVDAMPNGGRLVIQGTEVPRLPGYTPDADDLGEGGRGPAGGARLDIADTGCGISPEDARRLFTPFFTTKPKGTGIGLSVVERIVRAHNGHLEVETHGPRPTDRGTTFHVWLPKVPRPLPAEPVSGQTEDSALAAEEEDLRQETRCQEPFAAPAPRALHTKGT